MGCCIISSSDLEVWRWGGRRVARAESASSARTVRGTGAGIRTSPLRSAGQSYSSGTAARCARMTGGGTNVTERNDCLPCANTQERMPGEQPGQGPRDAIWMPAPRGIERTILPATRSGTVASCGESAPCAEQAARRTATTTTTASRSMWSGSATHATERSIAHCGRDL